MKKFYLILVCALLTICGFAQQYTNGVFLLNEDWFGHNSSTVNFFSYTTGAIQYRVFQKENEGKTLGNTTQFMAQDASNIYFCSKQNYGSTGGRFDVVDAKTLKLKQSIASFNGGGDTRACYPLSDTKVYVGSTEGIYIYNPISGKITSAPIEGTGSSEPGEMVIANGKLFVCAMGSGVYVINTSTDILETTIQVSDACTIFKVNDEVWVATNSCTWGTPGSSDTEQFVEIDTESLVANTPVEVGIACQNSSFAWKKTSPAIDAQNKVLYYAPVDCANYISKYDMVSGDFTQNFITLPDGQNMYGSVCDIDPNTGNLVVLTFEQWGSQNYYLHIYDKEGKEVGEQIQLEQNYWFPAMVMFTQPETIPSGITDACTNKSVASVRYVNLAGVSSHEPFSGVNIVVTTYTDGTQSAVKVIK
ncbi:MAG: DUF5074 domain-containing protein [Sodaliphilus sp.]